MKKFIVCGFAILLAAGGANASTVTRCVVRQCADGYFATEGFMDYKSGETMYTKCTKCPGKMLASGGTAKVRTWQADVIGSPHTGLTLKPVAPNEPLLEGACYISPYDYQTFKDSTGNWQYSGGDCKY
ncbi:MAG TPA: hypothetical protein DEA31_00190 [Alphaproteobacteria bacterium]|nr:hypothetical protein [Alphaproteobacteria bacterium]